MSFETSTGHLFTSVGNGELGSGRYGVVSKVLSTRTRQVHAAKRARRSTGKCCLRDVNCACNTPSEPGEMRIQAANGVEREAEVLRQLKHPHIISLLGVGSSDTRPFFIIPFAPFGNTFNVPSIFQPFLSTFINHVASALLYLHTVVHISHTDLTNKNILIMGSTIAPVFVVCDFGASRPIDPATGFGDVRQNKFAYQCLTTAEYAAPETFGHDTSKVDKRAADVWSFGMCILGFCHWFNEKNTNVWEKADKRITFFFNIYTQRESLSKNYITDERIYKYLCDRMLRHNVSNRDSVLAIIEYFSKNDD